MDTSNTLGDFASAYTTAGSLPPSKRVERNVVLPLVAGYVIQGMIMVIVLFYALFIC